MVALNRRSFIGGALSFAGLGCSSIAGVSACRPKAVFGVISDLHVTTPESTAVFRRSLEYFRSRNVDAVVIAGDLTDWGLRSGLRNVADAWYDVFPGDLAPDGHKVEKLFCTGNHDYEGWGYEDITLDMHVQGYSEDDALVRHGMKKCWEETFGEPFEPIRRRKIRGYDFISAEWKRGKNCLDEAGRWLKAHADDFDPGRPFFFFTHYPICNTTSCSGGDGVAVYPEGTIFESFPNAVVLSGHCHWTLNDERSIWQKSYTAVAIPSMSYTSMPACSHENGTDWRNGTARRSMPRLPARDLHIEAQGFVMSVHDGYIEMERRDFTEGVEAAPAWIVTPPTSEPSRFSPEGIARRMPVPQFPDGAEVKTFTRNIDARNGHWAVMVMLDFPSAHATGGRVFDYEVRVEMEDGAVFASRKFLAPAFYRLERDEPERQLFAFDAMALPERGRYRLRVYPGNFCGVRGRPIESKTLESSPGRDKVLFSASVS